MPASTPTHTFRKPPVLRRRELFRAGLFLFFLGSMPLDVAQGAESDKRLSVELQTFVGRHCLECHGPKKQEAELRLDTLGDDLADREVFEA